MARHGRVWQSSQLENNHIGYTSHRTSACVSQLLGCAVLARAYSLRLKVNDLGPLPTRPRLVGRLSLAAPTRAPKHSLRMCFDAKCRTVRIHCWPQAIRMPCGRLAVNQRHIRCFREIDTSDAHVARQIDIQPAYTRRPVRCFLSILPPFASESYRLMLSWCPDRLLPPPCSALSPDTHDGFAA